ncbi:MAG: type I methionyl aminopeptidase [Spirochaetota bacterium]
MIVIKNEEQIAGIKNSCRLLAQLHEQLRAVVRAGMTTKEIDTFCYDFISRHEAVPAFLGYMGFPATACISTNKEIIHGIPGDRRLAEGDLVSIDIGINLDGYYSDAAQSIEIGQCSDEVQQLNKTTQEALYLGIEKVKPGARIHAISQAVSKHASVNHFGVVREYCGHGVGLSPHEDPQIPNYVSMGPNPRMRAGMVLAIEPMINLGSRNIKQLDDGWTVVTADGKPSAHWEHTVLVTEEGYEILTAL